MLYSLLKIPARIALPFYCRKIIINHPAYVKSKGPLLLACNHPNSFLDATILATLFDKPVYSLARGDAFSKKWSAFLLKHLHILPVYREREGTEHLHKNYHTFDACTEIFKQNGIVLIFSEALCENEWHLRPLKKGTARLAMAAWQQNLPLQILPVGINYSSFHSFGKNIHLNFGSFIEKPAALTEKETGKLLADITGNVQQQLKQLVFEIDKNDRKKQSAIFAAGINRSKKILLTIPAVIGKLLYWPLYIPVEKLVSTKAFHSVHYDSIMVGMLFLLFPLYVLLLCLFTYFLAGGYWWMITFVLAPFCAWSYVQLKKQID